MQKTVKLLPPSMPNSINVERPAGTRQEGIDKGWSLSISELSEKEAEEYGELMKQTFIKHHKQKMHMVKNTPSDKSLTVLL